MELEVEEWSELSAEELMDKKEAIETEMQACNTVLENVRLEREDNTHSPTTHTHTLL